MVESITGRIRFRKPDPACNGKNNHLKMELLFPK